MSWFTLSCVSLTFFGLQNYLYKISALKDLNTRAVTMVYVLFSTCYLWANTLFSYETIRFDAYLVVLGLLDAVFYYCTTVWRIEALKFISTSLAFTIVRMSTILVVIFSVLFLGEGFSWKLALSLLILITAVFLLNSERQSDTLSDADYPRGITLSLLALVTSAGTNIISKLAATHGSIELYMSIANSIIVLIAFGEKKCKNTFRWTELNRASILVGLGLAASNLIAWFSYLYALKSGPLGVVATISSLSFAVPIILSRIFHGEVLSTARWLAVIATVIALTVLHSARL